MARPAFTLIEVLIVMVIVAVLVALLVTGLVMAPAKAQDAATKVTLLKLSQMFEERAAAFEGRPIDPRAMPHWWEEINDSRFQPASTSPADLARSSSELLYFIIANPVKIANPTITIDQFVGKEVGDTDNDGLMEILDSWGNPVWFLRDCPEGDLLGYDGSSTLVNPTEDINGNGVLDTGEDTNSNGILDSFFSYALRPRGTGSPFTGFVFPSTFTKPALRTAPRAVAISAGPDGEFGFRLNPKVVSPDKNPTLAGPSPKRAIFDLVVDVSYPEDRNGNGTLDSGEDSNGNGVLDPKATRAQDNLTTLNP